jgi:WD40 repeat protein
VLSPPGWPTEPSDGDGQPRRWLIAAGTANYEHLGDEEEDEDFSLPTVVEDVEAVARLFCGQFGYQRVLPDLAKDPTKDQLHRSLNRWFTDPARSPHDVVVLYYSGHGLTHGGRHYLLTRDSQMAMLESTALPTAELAHLLGGESRVQQLLIMLDTCHAGRGAAELSQVAGQLADLRAKTADVPGLWFVAAARPKEEARQAVFARALVAAATSPRGGPRMEYVAMEDVVGQINDKFREEGREQRAEYRAGGSRVPPFIPNLDYNPALAGVRRAFEDAMVAHWDPKARGVALASDPGSYFTGREKVLRELVAWLGNPDADHRARVVTGDPGSGKSAVLARLVTQADAGVSRHASSSSTPPGTVPPEGSIDIAIYAKGHTVTGVLARLAAETGVEATTPDELVQALVDRPRRRMVILDALDEANDPEDLIAKLLRPLLDTAPRSGLRLLVGARRPQARALGDRIVVFDLDDEAYMREEDLAQYVANLLLAEHWHDQPTPYRSRPDLARQVAAAVARQASPSFLIARIVAQSLLTAEPVDTTRSEWQVQFPDSVGQAFDGYLERFGHDEQRVRDLLAPLAFAEGSGLPWGQLWRSLARGLSGNDAYSDGDIRWLLSDVRAKAYVTEAEENGRSVFRLYHQALAKHLRAVHPSEEPQRRIVQILQDPALVPVLDGHRAWSSADPYIRTHLATHAAKAGQLDPLLADPGFLLGADPDRLVPAMRRIKLERHKHQAVDTYRTADIYRTALPQLRGRALPEAAAYLQLAARQRGDDGLAERINELGLPLPWSVVWAHLEGTYPHWLIGRHTGSVTAIAVAKPSGRPVAVTGDTDGVLHVWDLARDIQLQSLSSSLAWIGAVAIADVNSRPVAIAGDRMGTVRVWDITSGTQVHEFTDNSDFLRTWAMLVVHLDGHPLAVAGGDDPVVRVWDLTRGTALLQLAGHTGKIRALGAIELGAHPVVITGDDQAIRLWDLADGQPLASVLHKHRWSLRLAELRFRNRSVIWSSPSSRVAVTKVDGRPIAITTIGGDRTIRVWDLTSRKQLHKLTGHIGSVNAVAVAEVDGRPVAISGGNDPVVRVWDLATGTQLHQLNQRFSYNPLAEWVYALAVAQVDGRPIAITAGQSVRVWDLARGTELYKVTAHTGDVPALAVAELEGHPIAISGGYDHTVRAWDLSRKTVDDSNDGGDTADSSWVKAVAATELDGHPVAVTANSSGTVRVWDLANGTRMRKLTVPGGPVMAVAKVDGRTVVLTGSFDQRVRVWDLANDTHIRKLGLRSYHVNAIAVATVDGRPVAVTGGNHTIAGNEINTVRVWDLQHGKLLYSLAGHTDSIYVVAAGALNGRPVAVTGGRGEIARVWDLTNGRQLHELRGHKYSVDAIAVTELDGRPVAITGSGDGTVRIWDLGHNQQVRELIGHTRTVQAVAIGKLNSRPVAITGGADETVRVWDLPQGRELVRIVTGAVVWGVALGPQHMVIVGTSAGILVVRLNL